MNLLEFIATNKIILLDGAMGTQLAAAGFEMGGVSNILHPEGVLAIHQKYLASGVDIIFTNTLTMNRAFIEAHKVNVDVREVNLAGVRIAKKAVHAGQYVLGDISSTGRLLKPYGDLPVEEAYKSFKEQATLLAEGGVDGFIIETMFDLEEALCALRACREVSGLPVMVTISFNTAKNGGRTIMGNCAQDCARKLTDAGASAIGANCGNIDPSQSAEIVTKIKEVSSLPIVVKPNAGRPKVIDKKIVFEMSPADFASGVQQCLRAGASLVGGCCGTSPAHIRVLAELVGKGPTL